MKWIFSLIAIISMSGWAFGQESKQTLIDGNASFREGDFSAAEEAYRKAGDDKSLADVAQFNLGDALYRQGKFDEAADIFGKLAQSSENESIRSRSYHNLGNSMLSKQDYAKAMQAYKQALKLNPQDQDARYNLAYARQKLQQQQQQQQQQQEQGGQDDQDKQDKQDGDQDQQQDGQKNQDEQGNPDQQDQQDKNKGDQDQQQNGNDKQNDQGQDGKDGQDQQQDGNEKQQEQAMPEPGQMSAEDAARILEAIDKAEQDLQGKLRKHKGTGPAKKIEKDW